MSSLGPYVSGMTTMTTKSWTKVQMIVVHQTQRHVVFSTMKLPIRGPNVGPTR